MDAYICNWCETTFTDEWECPNCGSSSYDDNHNGNAPTNDNDLSEQYPITDYSEIYA